MKPATSKLTEAARSVHQLQIDGFSATDTMGETGYIESVWTVDGYQCEVRIYPNRNSWVALQLVLLSKPAETSMAKVNFRCRLVDVDPSQDLEPSEDDEDPCPEATLSRVFHSRQEQSKVFNQEKRHQIPPGYLKNDSLTLECTITVLKEILAAVIPDSTKKDDEPLPLPLPLPSSDLHNHLGELLESHKGADVTFHVAGESFAAHKAILAARSPVFAAEFFGHMEERTSRVVEVQDMAPAAFKAMLRFVYTDVAPELDGPAETAVTMAQRLLAAADRYGLGRLKLICEAKLSGGIDVGTAATTLALAEQHNCSLLKAKCVEFITGSPETLDAVLATEGYNHLAASCPLVLAQLLKAARGRKN